jgi:UDP-N-acetylmuramoyl-L-alanyl-D-glutamate--2,6-diaminopimelate ligase
LSSRELNELCGLDVGHQSICDIHWKSQDSNPQSLLFYKIGNSQNDLETFRSRMHDTEYGWLILNKQIDPMPMRSSFIEEIHWPQIQKKILDELYPLPDMKLIGITGTNGKTTTTDLILQAAHLIGKEGLSIGTLGVREFGKTILEFGLTSPSLIDLRKYLNIYGKGKDFCVMEVSSHALVQDRYYGIEFDEAGWLSFTQDHLDFHKTMDEYFNAKSLILRKLKNTAILFVPAEQKDLLKRLELLSSKVRSAEIIQGELPIFFKAQFNKNNLEVALSIIKELWGKSANLDFTQLKSPDGRFYIRPFKSNYIVVDFAHTPDALENICRGLKEAYPGHRLKVLFGCGGDRDRSKRPQMGSIASTWADEIYVTSDNPRSENPDQIISDILKGISGNNYQAITDRRIAVQLAFKELKDKEILLLAGKGHEDYILINGVKYPYSDIKEADEFVLRNEK